MRRFVQPRAKRCYSTFGGHRRVEVEDLPNLVVLVRCMRSKGFWRSVILSEMEAKVFIHDQEREASQLRNSASKQSVLHAKMLSCALQY